MNQSIPPARSDVTTQKCNRCQFRGPPSAFPRKANLQPAKSCRTCLQNRNATYHSGKHQQANKENRNTGGTVTEAPIKAAAQQQVLTLSWLDILSLLLQNKDSAFEMDVFVKFDDPEAPKTGRDRVKEVVEGVRAAIGFKFK
jgi:hypothetical protein